MGKSFDKAKITGRTVKEDLRNALGVEEEDTVQKAPEAEETEEEPIPEEEVNEEEELDAEEEPEVRDKRWHMHTTASPEEKAIREAEGRTRGRKGCKAPRINLAFKTPVYDYVLTMARSNGKTLTQFINAKLEEARAKDKKYQKLKAVLEEDDEED